MATTQSLQTTTFRPAQPPATIRARGLTRDFGTVKSPVHAVRGLDLDVDEGELVAFLGPNGAGKTTALRMLTTLLAPTAGEAVVAGHDVVTDPAAVRKRIGYLGQGNGGAHHQRVRDELFTQGRAYRLSRAEARARADELLDSLELGAVAGRTVGTLSGGQRRRMDIAMALVHAPSVLFLDEPSTGLDPQSRANLWAHITRLRESHGTTVFLTTHYLEEADGMAERVLVIDAGRVVADDTPAQLKRDLSGDLVVLHAADPADGPRISAVLGALDGSQDLATTGSVVRVRVPDGARAVPDLVRHLDGLGVTVAGAEVHPPTLDDVFLAATGRRLREEGVVGDPDRPAGADAEAGTDAEVTP